MKVLYFSRDYTTHDRRFLFKLADSRHDIWYLRLEDDGINYEARPLPMGVQSVAWAGGSARFETPEKFLRLLPDLDRVLNEVEPDVVHAGPVSSCGLMMALLDFHPLLVASWGSDILVEADRDEWSRWATRFTLNCLDAFLCDCRPVRDKAQRIASIPDDRVVMFPWGIELARYRIDEVCRAKRRAELGWQGYCVVVSTRSWHPGYGVDLVVESFAHAYRQNPSLRLLLLGSGSAEEKISSSIMALGVNDVVYCPGQVSEAEMLEWFSAADIYLCCTPSDGTSISLLEAMAMRLPAVVTDNAGNQQWVSDGINGRLIPYGNVGGFASALLELAGNAQTTQDMGHIGRRITFERADWDQNISLLLDAYESLAREKRRKAS